MRENLSARGSLADWIDDSEEALWNAGFERVEVDEMCIRDRCASNQRWA